MKTVQTMAYALWVGVLARMVGMVLAAIRGIVLIHSALLILILLNLSNVSTVQIMEYAKMDSAYATHLTMGMIAL